MPVTDFHRMVATIALEVAADYGFALAGSNALMTHGVIDRVTQDVDLFTSREGGVEAAADAVEKALRQSGFEVERQDKTAGLSDIWDDMGNGMAEWIVSSPGGQEMQLQLAYFDRGNDPVLFEVGPVLSLEDVAGGKTAALASRVEPRDYADVAALLGRFTPEQLIGFARKLDPGLEPYDFAAAGRRLDGLNLARRFEVARFSREQIAWIREQFRDWPR